MSIPYAAPEFQQSAFNCPYCNAYASQKWDQLTIFFSTAIDAYAAQCSHCLKYSLWHIETNSGVILNASMIYPKVSPFPLSHPDMPQDIAMDYCEARNIGVDSPRAAAALLRLALQKLLTELEHTGNINDAIGELVKKGLPLQIQQGLDTIRVIGNNAVHPGELDIKDDTGAVHFLFQCLNIIVEHMITQPRKAQEMFDLLPQGAIDAIARRDG